MGACQKRINRLRIKHANVSEHVNFPSGHKEQSLISRCPYEADATRSSTVFQNFKNL